MRCRNDAEEDDVEIVEVEYRADAGDTSLVLRTLRLASPDERCDDGRGGGDGDLSGKYHFMRFLVRNVSICGIYLYRFGDAE